MTATASTQSLTDHRRGQIRLYSTIVSAMASGDPRSIAPQRLAESLLGMEVTRAQLDKHVAALQKLHALKAASSAAPATLEASAEQAAQAATAAAGMTEAEILALHAERVATLQGQAQAAAEAVASNAEARKALTKHRTAMKRDEVSAMVLTALGEAG